MRPDLRTDVCIIGGAIAGNLTALGLRQKGISCIVIEEHSELGLPCHCAGIVAQKITQLTSFPNDIIQNRVKDANIIAPNLNSIIMRGRENPVIIDRVRYDAYFGEEAQKLGAQYLMNEKYQTHWALPNGHTLIKTDKHQIEAKLLVGADGPFSKVAARFGIKHNLIPATQAYIKMEAPLHQAAMYFNPKWKELFGYVVPEGKNGICRVGLATKQHPNQAFETFLKILHVQPKQIIGRSGGVIPLGFPRRIAFRNTLLIGDSACMVKATTGGGIVMIATASKILITAIEKALHANDFSQEYLVKQYQRPIKNSIGLQLKIHYFIRLVVMALKNYDFNNFFKLYLGTNMGQVLSKNADMDFPLRVVRKLIRNKYFIRFLAHIFIRNWLLIPQLLHDIAL